MFFSIKNWVDHKEMFNSIIKILVDQPQTPDLIIYLI